MSGAERRGACDAHWRVPPRSFLTRSKFGPWLRRRPSAASCRRSAAQHTQGADAEQRAACGRQHSVPESTREYPRTHAEQAGRKLQPRDVFEQKVAPAALSAAHGCNAHSCGGPMHDYSKPCPRAIGTLQPPSQCTLRHARMVRTQQAAAVRTAGACDEPHKGEQHARVGVCRYGYMRVCIHTTRGRAADTRGCRSPRECARRPACGRANVAPLQRITRTRRMFACAISHAACCTPPGAHCAAAACCGMVAPERLVGAAEQRARFEQLAPPQQLLRFAVQQLRLQLNPLCSVRRKAAAGVRPVASAAAQWPSRTHAVGAWRYRWGCASVHACEAGGCTSVHACAGVSECMHAQAHARTRLSPLALRSLRCTTLPAWSVSSTKYLPANSRAQTSNHACHRALHVAMWRSCIASRSHAVHHTS